MNSDTRIIPTVTIVDNITETIELFSGHQDLQNASYETGLLGFSLYYLYLSEYKNEPRYLEVAAQYLQKGMDALDLKNFKRSYNTDSLDLHLSHIGRFLIFCKKNNWLDLTVDEYLLRLDEILFDLMKSKISIKDFDTGSGAMASALYFHARHSNGFPQDEQLRYLVNSLDNFAEKDDDGNYFWKSPSLYNRVYLGISHGSAMVISMLCNIHQLGIETELCQKNIEKASNFLTRQYRRTKYKGLFPTKLGDRVEPMQFALCYGDLGTGYALLKAAQTLNSQKTLSLAQLILNDCLHRTKEDNLTLDASIYYGAAGLAIGFEKLGKLTRDTRFSDRAKYWAEQIPTYAIYGPEFAGFRSRLSNDSVIWNISEGWGLIGIGLALMISEKDVLPKIDSLTFLS